MESIRERLERLIESARYAERLQCKRDKTSVRLRDEAEEGLRRELDELADDATPKSAVSAFPRPMRVTDKELVEVDRLAAFYMADDGMAFVIGLQSALEAHAKLCERGPRLLPHACAEIRASRAEALAIHALLDKEGLAPSESILARVEQYFGDDTDFDDAPPTPEKVAAVRRNVDEILARADASPTMTERERRAMADTAMNRAKESMGMTHEECHDVAKRETEDRELLARIAERFAR